MRRRRLLWAAGLASLGGLYVKVVCPRTMRWGATDEEVAQRLPGDDLVAGSRYRATRAITIDPRPELDERRTRLITRMQERYPPLFSRKTLYAVVASTGDIVMHWKQLRGIKERAERPAAAADQVSPGPADAVAARAS